MLNDLKHFCLTWRNLLSFANASQVGSYLAPAWKCNNVQVFLFEVIFIFLSVFPASLVEDLERNDGSAERPYLMSDRLLKVLNKKNKPEPAE